MSLEVGVKKTIEHDLNRQERELSKLEAALPKDDEGPHSWKAQRQKVGELWDRLDKYDRNKNRRRWYIERHRSGCLLAILIKMETQPRPILEIGDRQDKLAYTQHKINAVFAVHLVKIYTEPQHAMCT